MLEFKEETQQTLQGEAVNIHKIAVMEKQLMVFREEALKLFDRGLKKDKEIEQLQMRVEEFLSEKEHMDSTVKGLIKRNKELEAMVKSSEERGRLWQ
jgi:aspartyl/asparaginyl beta-hydroxylase (cupin superfamily)